MQTYTHPICKGINFQVLWTLKSKSRIGTSISISDQPLVKDEQKESDQWNGWVTKITKSRTTITIATIRAATTTTAKITTIATTTKSTKITTIMAKTTTTTIITRKAAKNKANK